MGKKIAKVTEWSAKDNGAKDSSVSVKEQPVRDIRVTIAEGIDTGKTTKYVGRHILKTKDEPVLFLSLRKGLTIYLDEKNYVIFKNNTFETNDPELIDFLENGGEWMGSEVFKDKFPPEIMEKIKDEQKYFSKDPEEYDKG